MAVAVSSLELLARRKRDAGEAASPVAGFATPKAAVCSSLPSLATATEMASAPLPIRPERRLSSKAANWPGAAVPTVVGTAVERRSSSPDVSSVVVGALVGGAGQGLLGQGDRRTRRGGGQRDDTDRRGRLRQAGRRGERAGTGDQQPDAERRAEREEPSAGPPVRGHARDGRARVHGDRGTPHRGPTAGGARTWAA